MPKKPKTRTEERKNQNIEINSQYKKHNKNLKNKFYNKYQLYSR